MGLSFFPLIAMGGYLSLALAIISAPICMRGIITLCIGRWRNDSSPVRTERKGFPESTPERSLIVVPEFPQSMMLSGSLIPLMPLPSMIISSHVSFISTPNALKAVIVLKGSSALRKFFIMLFPFAREDSMTALCDIDLSGGEENSPLKNFALLSSMLSNTFPQCQNFLKENFLPL